MKINLLGAREARCPRKQSTYLLDDQCSMGSCELRQKWENVYIRSHESAHSSIITQVLLQNVIFTLSWSLNTFSYCMLHIFLMHSPHVLIL